MSLADKLDRIRRDFEEGDTPQEIIDVLNANIERLLLENVADRALKIGDQAPLDSVIFYEQSELPLKHFLESDYLVLNWFRGNW